MCDNLEVIGWQVFARHNQGSAHCKEEVVGHVQQKSL